MHTIDLPGFEILRLYFKEWIGISAANDNASELPENDPEDVIEGGLLTFY